MKGPGWPDTRGWGLLGLFALSGGILFAIALNPALEKNELFSSLSTLIVGAGGFLGAIGYLFGTSKGSTDKDATITALSQNPSNPSPSPTLPVFDTGAPTPKPDPNFQPEPQT